MSFDLNSLGAYVDQEMMGLIRAAVLEGRTMDIINVQPGIKSSASINILSTDAIGQAGSCGFDASGTTEITQRDIDVNSIKVQESVCPEDLEAYFTQKMLNAGSYVEDLGGVEAVYAADKVAHIQSLIETLVWQGDTAGSGQLALTNGLLKAIDAEASVVDGNTSAATGITAANVIDLVDDMVDVIPADAINSDDLKLFVGYETFRMYARALRDANLYHYPSTGDGTQDFRMFVPGTNVEMIAVKGLNGTDRMILAEASNLYAGVDLLNDYEDFRLWYSQDNQEVRFNSRFKLGSNCAFPERIVEYSNV